MAWSPEQYTKFEDERNRPIRDLLAQIPGLDAVSHVIDLGCGPGNSTQSLAEACKIATVEGIDSSAEMIDAARLRLPTSQFRVQDITVWARTDGFRDLIFSNAALQWVPDHETLISALFGKLAKCGTLAVQIPDNSNEPSHQLLRAAASRDCWRNRLIGAGRTLDGRREAAWYYQTLIELGAKVNMWRTTYYHPLQGGSAAVVELFKGTALHPYLELLDTKEQISFLDDYETAIAQAYPALLDGTVLLPFPRLFFVAQAP